ELHVAVVDLAVADLDDELVGAPGVVAPVLRAGPHALLRLAVAALPPGGHELVVVVLLAEVTVVDQRPGALEDRADLRRERPARQHPDVASRVGPLVGGD